MNDAMSPTVEDERKRCLTIITAWLKPDFKDTEECSLPLSECPACLAKKMIADGTPAEEYVAAVEAYRKRLAEEDY